MVNIRMLTNIRHMPANHLLALNWLMSVPLSTITTLNSEGSRLHELFWDLKMLNYCGFNKPGVSCN